MPSPWYELDTITADIGKGPTPTFDHSNTAPRMINAATSSAGNVQVEFKWTQDGSLTAGTLPISYTCQVNFEEEGRVNPAAGATQDMNVSAAIPFIAANTPVTPGTTPGVPAGAPASFNNEYTYTVKTNLGAAAGELKPGMYTVTVLFFTIDTNTSTKTIAGFVELGKVNVT